MGHLGYLSEVEVNGEERQRMGNHLFGTFGHDFQCKDGRRVMIVGVSPNQWKAIVMITQSANQVDSLEQELGLSFRKEGDRFEAREQLRQLFIPWFSQHNYEEVTKAMNEAGVCWGPYQSIQQLVESDIDCSENNPLFDLVEQPGIGPYLMPSQPLNFTALRKLSAKPAPLLGEHTDEILSDLLGLDSSEIGLLHDSGIVAGPES
jgi:2-methylfumaryl-CoA isomerase